MLEKRNIEIVSPEENPNVREADRMRNLVTAALERGDRFASFQSSRENGYNALVIAATAVANNVRATGLSVHSHYPAFEPDKNFVGYEQGWVIMKLPAMRKRK